MPAIKPIVDSYFIPLEEALATKHIDLGLQATGNWLETLRYEIKQQGISVLVEVLAPDYTENLIPPGQEPTNVELIDITNWVFAKDGLPPDGFTVESFAWIVTQKIRREGVMVPNQFNEGTALQPIQEFIDSEKPVALATEIGFDYVTILRDELVKQMTDNLTTA